MALLEVSGLTAGYGDLAVLYGLDFEVEEGETGVLLGLNGAGKTTTMMCLAGLLKPTGGKVVFDGEEVTGKDAKHMVGRRVVLSPEGRRVFPGLTVDKNMMIGGWTKRRDKAFVQRQTDMAYDYFPRLRERREQMAGTLSGGEQQMLAIARAMMGDPRLLLIDEASLGLAPVIVKLVFDIIKQINESGVTVILVEQNIGALKIADRAFVIEKGTLVYQARGQEVREGTALREAYMGAPA
ncbi:MAG TPA: ABC transporter ATP-binding protein [Actinomycetota bacterium]|nr:ABC transporter ATP-binding protein [Actinomycetota bacterium]